MNRTLELAAMLLAPTLLATAPVVAQDPTQATPVTVEVTGFSPAEGHLVIALFDSAATWSGGTAVEGQRIAVEGPTVEVSFGALPAGDYAIKLYHDVDSDGEMATNLVGIPTEPYAFSNNALGRMGPASWADARFRHTGDGAVQSITLN